MRTTQYREKRIHFNETAHRMASAAVILTTLISICGCSLDDNYFDARQTNSYQLAFTTIPASQIDSTPVFTSNGNQIYGVFIKSPTASETTPTILYFHGNDKDIDKYVPRLQYLYPLNCNIFIFDYQGYGKSTGSPSISGIEQNAVDALAYLKARSDVNANKIIYYGFSLGAVFALHLAVTTAQPVAFIGESVIASSDNLVKTVLRTSVPSKDFFDQTFDDVAAIKQVKAPILLLAGTNDEKAPFHDNAVPIFDAAPQPKTTLAIQGATHDTIVDVLGQTQYDSVLQTFLTNNGLQ